MNNLMAFSLCTGTSIDDYIYASVLDGLSRMLLNGGLGAVRVVELLKINAVKVFRVVFRFLDEEHLYQENGLFFVASLCQSCCQDTRIDKSLSNSLHDLLDAPVLSIDDKIIENQQVCYLYILLQLDNYIWKVTL